jgi:hypothetical protein
LAGIAAWVICRPTVFAPRYIMASLLVLLLVGARGAEHVLIGSKPSRAWLSASIGLALLGALALGILQFRVGLRQAIQVLVGRSSQCDFEMANSDASCRIARIINAEAAPQERVLLAAYYRYWLRPDIIQCSSQAEEEAALRELPSMGDRWSYFYDRGFRYLVVDTLTHAYILDVLDIHRMPEWLEVTPLFDGDTFLAYRFDSTDPARPRLATCIQVDAPAWEVVPSGGP